ncbi:MAG: DUF1501 domain-containing protein [Planctomycetales bacterium]|nr:DUF1501 domain-containing protein [Planctomycetales bacterium]
MSRPTPTDHWHTKLARRAFLGRAAQGVGGLALASLLDPSLLAAAELERTTSQLSHGGVLGSFHRPPQIKRVIFLCMAGGPSHLETFDYKPKLAEMDGKPMPASVTTGQPIAQLQGAELVCMGPRFEFARHGASGQEISSVLPHIAGIADDICIIRSMHTEQINHDPAHTFMNTGTQIPGRPSMGSWINYGLGSESDDLPGFVVMTSVGGRNPQPIATRQWHNGFLPSEYQGVEFHSQGSPVHYVQSPAGVDARVQRDVVDAVAEINRRRNDVLADPEIAARIRAYEMAFRMQTSVPELKDLSDESAETLELYGTKGADGSFAANCLLARRLAERGVRFIQLYHRGWDHHNDIVPFMQQCAGYCDRPTAALITDLKRRGMLDETLVVWTGEFGRTPMSQSGKGERLGRDHHIRGFSMFLAGGGIKGGYTHGATDDLGYHAVEDTVDVHDLHATMLHLLGIDHLRLTYRFQGRDFRLTDIAGRVVKEILA